MSTRKSIRCFDNRRDFLRFSALAVCGSTLAACAPAAAPAEGETSSRSTSSTGGHNQQTIVTLTAQLQLG